ncbi:MAG: ribonuclease E inhibitor RraB [Gammaproteobacteria bacterium]
MKWVLLLLVVFAGIAVIYRFYSTMKKGRQVHGRDWDTRLIAEMRKRGQDPFQSHDVDFFFALPSSDASAALNRQLEAEGFRIDVKAVPENKEFPFSLHASKNMRVLAPEMQALSKHFNELAKAHNGRYDGWGS